MKRLGESRQIAEDEFGFLNKKEIQDIQQSVWKAFAAYALKVTDQDMEELVLWLYVQKLRLITGNGLKTEKNMGGGRKEYSFGY